MTPLEKTEAQFNDMIDILVKSAKGGVFDNQRIDSVKTVINVYGKLNQTESAKKTNQLIAIRMVAKDKEEERKLVLSGGFINEGIAKQLK